MFAWPTHGKGLDDPLFIDHLGHLHDLLDVLHLLDIPRLKIEDN